MSFRLTECAVKTVLVPIDGSKCSLRALDHAIAECRGRGAKVHLLNVEPKLDEYGMVQAYLTKSRHREVTSERARQRLQVAEERLAKARIASESHVIWDEAAPAIARAASRLRCDAIVMGTRGMGAAGNLLLGSCAAKVVHLAKVPVTLVK
jgi:nucleotide-binding universal stress UspA family protein